MCTRFYDQIFLSDREFIMSYDPYNEYYKIFDVKYEGIRNIASIDEKLYLICREALTQISKNCEELNIITISSKVPPEYEF